MPIQDNRPRSIRYERVLDYAKSYQIWAYCEADRCAHHALLDLEAIAANHGNLMLPEMKRRLTCTVCRQRQAAIRISTRYPHQRLCW